MTMSTVVHEYTHYLDFKDLRGEDDVWSVTIHKTLSNGILEIFLLPPDGMHTAQIGGEEKVEEILRRQENTELKANIADTIFVFISFSFLAIFLSKRWNIMPKLDKLLDKIPYFQRRNFQR